jgi:hypothetical protein
MPLNPYSGVDVMIASACSDAIRARFAACVSAATPPLNDYFSTFSCQIRQFTLALKMASTTLDWL